MMPFANLFARSFGEKNLEELKNISKDEVSAGCQLFLNCVKAMFEQRRGKLRNQTSKLQALPEGDSKFGGVLEGGNVDDFHRGIAERLGESL